MSRHSSLRRATSSLHAPICRRPPFTSSSRILSVRSTGRSTQPRTAGTDGARLRRSDMAHLRRKGGWSWTLGATDKRYTNNREITQAFDVSTWDVAARFYYRIAPETRLLAEIRDTEYDYRSSPLDNSEQRYLLGATWDITAATSGTLKVGYVTTKVQAGGAQRLCGSDRWRQRCGGCRGLIRRSK